MAAHATVRETLQPVVVDLSRGENEIKNAIREALQKTPPMFAVTGYGFENKFDHIVAAMRQRHNLHATSPDHASSRCVSFPLTDLPGGGTTEADIKSDLCALTWRICDLIMGPAFAHRLKVENQEIGGTVSMRFYPQRSADSTESCNLLGAHVDGNFITILWSDARGLQVPSTSAPISVGDVAGIGIPSVGPEAGSVFGDEHWVDVVSPSGSLVVSIGQGWFHSPAAQLYPAVPCATLHRVSIDGNMASDRHSIPFLARLESRGKP